MAQPFNLRDFRSKTGAPSGTYSSSSSSSPYSSQPSHSSFFGRKSIFERGFSMDTMLRMTDLPEAVRAHLVQVYSALCFTLLAAAAGAYVHTISHIGGMLTGFACMGLFMLIMQEPQQNTQKRLGMLLGFGFFKGCSIGPLVEQAMYVDPGIIITALMGTTMIFACFTASSLAAKRRSYLYLGGVLSSIMSFMFLASLMNMFFASAGMWQLQLYVGLGVFCGYVLFDTQMIVEKAAGGDKDHIKHALELFIDFVEIFYRLVIILMKNAQEKNREDNRRKRR